MKLLTLLITFVIGQCASDQFKLSFSGKCEDSLKAQCGNKAAIVSMTQNFGCNICCGPLGSQFVENTKYQPTIAQTLEETVSKFIKQH